MDPLFLFPVSPRLRDMIAFNRSCVDAIERRNVALSLRSQMHYADKNVDMVGHLSFSDWYALVSSCPCCPDAGIQTHIRDQIDHTVCEEETCCAECGASISYYAYGSTQYHPIGFTDRAFSMDVQAPLAPDASLDVF